MLYQQAHDSWPLDWSSDGRRLLFAVGDVQSYAADSVGVLTLDGSEPVRFFADLSGQFGSAQFSPDGRWVAYSTSGGGIPQVYVRSTPGTAASATTPGTPDDAGRVQVSSAGGDIPRWRSDGRELYYARPDGAIVAVELAAGTMQPGRESVLFRAILRPQCAAFDASSDGERFVINALASAGAAPIVLVSGWNRELKGR
jgi:Tol biopolymer transport system component